MSSVNPDSEQHLTSKGKAPARLAQPTEQTPLLPASAVSVSSTQHLQDPPNHARRLASQIITVFLVSLSFCIIAVLILLFTIYSYRSRAFNVSPEDIIQRALVVKGPDWINVLNTSYDGSVWIEVSARVGLDAGDIVGVHNDQHDGVFKYLWKSIGRWGIHQLDRVTVNVSTVDVASEYNSSDVLASIIATPIEIPLTANPPHDLSWLTPVSVPLLIRPTKDVGAILRFVRSSWKQGFIDVRTAVDTAQVWGGGVNDRGWRRAFNVKHSNIETEVHIKLPTVPGAPPSGDHSPLPVFSKVVQLQSFTVVSSNNSLEVHANATVINPTPLVINFNFSAPSLPFTLALPPSPNETREPIPIVNINTQPFTFAHPNTTVPVIGTVLPLDSSASSALSVLLKNYVSGIVSPIVLTSPLLPNVTIDAEFPGANPRPHLLRNVTLKDMRIRIEGEAFLASGYVNARVVLPPGIDVSLDVSRILPDVLVFDGGVPPDEEPPKNDTDSAAGPPPAPPLPNPLPKGAIAHIRPEDWLIAHSEPIEGDPTDGTTVAVTARLVDAPVDILPGREDQFSRFVGKVIFGKEAALAGVKGTVAVSVTVHGLPLEDGKGQMDLSGLPFQGNVRVGKPKGLP